MRPTKRLPPLVDGLEPRIALSDVPTVVPLISPPSVQVSGRARGAAHVEATHSHNPFLDFQLRGIGAVSPLGRVTVRAEVKDPWTNGGPAGQVTLANPFGESISKLQERAPFRGP